VPRPNPLFQNLLIELRRLILQSYAPGEALPSQRALADMHGVGQTTAHRALSTLEREGLIEVRSRFNWQRSMKGSTQKNHRLSVTPLRVGVISRRNQRQINEDWTYQLLRREIEQRGWSVVWVPNPKQHHPMPRQNQIELRRVPWNLWDVALLFEVEDIATLDSPILKKHRVLSMDCDATPFGIESVTFDDFGAGRYAAKHLFELGHRRFALIEEFNGPGWPAEATWMQRAIGFQVEVGRLGGCIRPEYRIPASRKLNEDFKDHESGPRAVEAWMALPPKLRPTALFAVSLSPVPGMLNALRQNGLSVPRDLSIFTLSWSGPPALDDLNFTYIQLDFHGLVNRTLDVAAVLASRESTTVQKPALHLNSILLVPGNTTTPPKQAAR
jgi:DNA-binding transcriptional regulator YhcF (GntR family)